MKNKTDDRDIRWETKRIVNSHTLKRCNLCGAVNALSNKECFVCGWHGSFDTSPRELEEGVQELFERLPELASAMFNSLPARSRTTWFRRLVIRFATFLRGNVRKPSPRKG